MRKCLVTGATGLIGAQLLHALSPDWEVYALARTKPDITQPNIHHLPVNLATCWSPDLLPERMDAVVHLAQSEHFRHFPDKAEDIFQVNVASTLRLLDYARQAGVQHFVLASSGGVYGDHGQAYSEDEAITTRPDLGFYLSTKLCAEIMAENYASFMHVMMLRFFFVYGAGQGQSMLVPRLVQSVREGRPITLQGQDGIRINPTDVGDAVRAIANALHLEQSHKINIAGPDVLSLRQIGEIIGQATGRQPVFQVEADTPPRHLVGDIRKMSKLLGAPRIHFVDGIRALLT